MDSPQNSDEQSSTLSPRGELLALVRSLRGHLEELDASGAWGLPRAPALEAVAARSEAPRPSGPPLTYASARAPAAAAAAPGVAATVATTVATMATEEGLALPVPAEGSGRDAVRAPDVGFGASPRVHLPRASIERLRLLAEKTSTCTSCALHEGRHQTVFARGGGSSGVVFVGEGPGEEEDRQGLPFVGPAGQLLDRMIAAMQLGRDDVYVCNIVKCRPPKNRKPEPDEMARCMPFLVEQLSIIEPRVIIALGATAVQGLLGTTEGITRVRGQWKLWRGKVPVMPTFHPAYLLRTPQAKRDVWKDLQEVLRHLGGDAAPPA